MKNILALTILLVFTFQFSIAQCDLTFSTSNYNSFGVSCQNSCDGTISAIPSGISPYSYAWSSGELTQDITGKCSGTYVLTMTDGGGCVVTDSVVLTQPTALVANVNIASPITQIGNCDGEISAFANGSVPGYNYEWWDCTNQTISQTGSTNLCAGEWGVIVTDLNGCMDTACIDVNWPAGDSCAFIASAYYLGGLDCALLALASFNVDSYQWVNCDSNYAPFPGDTLDLYSSIYDGNVAVIISAYGCIDTSYCVDVCTWGIEEALPSQKELIKVVDFMGRDTEDKPNSLVIYVYSDGTTRKVFRTE